MVRRTLEGLGGVLEAMATAEVEESPKERVMPGGVVVRES